MSELRNFDSVVVGGYKINHDLYYKLLQLGVEDNLCNFAVFEDDVFRYPIFARAGDVSDFVKLSPSTYFLDSENHPWQILDSNGRVSGEAIIQIPMLIFLKNGNIYRNSDLLASQQLNRDFPIIVRKTAEIFKTHLFWDLNKHREILAN